MKTTNLTTQTSQKQGWTKVQRKSWRSFFPVDTTGIFWNKFTGDEDPLVQHIF
jgi:hypothetical protein